MELNAELLDQLPLELRIEVEENAMRLSPTQSEIAQQQERILEVLRKQSKPGRRTDLAPHGQTSAKTLAEVDHRATSHVGRMFGESSTTVEKRLAIVRAAEEEPEKFKKLVDDMDRTGRVDGVHKRLKVMRQEEAIRKEPPPLPCRGPYRVIVADPPWLFDLRKDDPSHHCTPDYPVMTIEEIKAIPVVSIAHPDCVLWLWTTNQHLREAFAVLDAWGFAYRNTLTWVKKNRMGMGSWLRGQTEHCLMASRGRPTIHLTNQTTALVADAREHSRKPAEFFEMVESLCPAPQYAELFARHSRERWDPHGNEITAAAGRPEASN